MSKKSRKRRRQTDRRRRSGRTDRSTATNLAKPVQTSSSEGRSDFSPDYTYVRQDLKRIVRIAGSLIVVLVALSFILR